MRRVEIERTVRSCLFRILFRGWDHNPKTLAPRINAARGHGDLILGSLVVLAAKFTRVNVGQHCALLHRRAGCYLSWLVVLLDRGETADDGD